jgi:hypothetical protein
MITPTQVFLFDDLDLDMDQGESEDDLRRASFKSAVVLNTDWTIETLYLQIKKGNIDLDPGFQRRSAWDHIRQSRLIESIAVGLPIPSIVLAESKDPGKSFIVLDGKQRLLAIKNFLEGELTLKGLDLRPDLNNGDCHTIPRADLQFIENSTMRTTVIKNWKDENFLYTTFFRLNSGSLPLSPQELRRALIGSKLLTAIDDYLENGKAVQKLFKGRVDRRMRDSELVLRFIAFEKFYSLYSGNLKEFLDYTTRYYEQNWNSPANDAPHLFGAFEFATNTALEIFGENAFKKWRHDQDAYERSLNRAVFDCQARYFTNPTVAAAAVKAGQLVEQAFRKECEKPDFRSAIEKTTKSKSATQVRLEMWGTTLAHVLGLNFDASDMRIS